LSKYQDVKNKTGLTGCLLGLLGDVHNTAISPQLSAISKEDVQVVQSFRSFKMLNRCPCSGRSKEKKTLSLS